MAVRADVELGGNDQIFNLLMGRQMQKDAGQSPQVVMTYPLLEGLDGMRKMSKSYGNHVALNDPPNDMFGKIMSVSDSMMWKYYELLTEEDLANARGLHPMEAKKRLAMEITRRFHGESEAEKARRYFESVFSKKQDPAEMDSFVVPKGGMEAAELLVETKLAPSKKEARRLLDQGAVTMNQQKVSPGTRISPTGPCVIKVGKRRFMKILPGSLS